MDISIKLGMIFLWCSSLVARYLREWPSFCFEDGMKSTGGAEKKSTRPYTGYPQNRMQAPPAVYNPNAPRPVEVFHLSDAANAVACAALEGCCKGLGWGHLMEAWWADGSRSGVYDDRGCWWSTCLCSSADKRS
jgi:hypothetical protein